MTAPQKRTTPASAIGENRARIRILEALDDSSPKVYAIKLLRDDENTVLGASFQFAIPLPLDGYRLVYVFAYVTTKDGFADVVATIINKGPDTLGLTSMLSTDITITTDTYNTEQGTPPVPDPANNQVATGDQIYLEITDEGNNYSMGFGYELWFDAD